MDILCFSSSDWDGKWGSRQQVMRIMARRGHRTLFVEQMAGWEHFAKYTDLRKRRRQRWREGVSEIEPNLWLGSPPPLLPGRYYLPAISKLNAGIVAHWVSSHLRKLNMPTPILWLYKPEHVELIPRLPHKKVVYHCIDEFTVGTAGRKKTIIQQLENRLLSQADVIFANSLLTYQNKLPANPHTFHVPSGADVEHFQGAAQTDVPAHSLVDQLPRPILMFVGNLNEKIDSDLLANIAEMRPNYSLVLIGQSFFKDSVRDKLHALGVYFLGKQPFAKLPAFLRAADVCLLPYVEGEATRYRSPIKLYEYLATGKPIISTPHPEVDKFASWVSISHAAQFPEVIGQVIQTDSLQLRQERLKEAEKHSWKNRVDLMLQILE